MRRSERKAIDNIILINPMLYGLQEKIEREQETVIEDMTAPAVAVVDRLVALDNRRIDLCNLNVLYAFIERELGERFSELEECAKLGIDSALYERAEAAAARVGYSVTRIACEFEYLFKELNTRRRKQIKRRSEESAVTVARTVDSCSAFVSQ